MASIQEKLAQSLEALKLHQERTGSLVVKGLAALGVTHTKRLVQAGYLQPIIKGWFMPSFPGSEGDSTVWYASYWQFIVAYANSRFGDAWCLTPEESLSFYAGDTVVPTQLVIKSPRGSNNVVSLLFGDSLLDISTSIPQNVVTEPRYGLRLYSLVESLVMCTPQFYKSDALNARTCLSMVKDANEIIKLVADEGNTTRASRLVGAFRNVGREDVADAISSFMKRLGHDVRSEDPFAEQQFVSSVAQSPYATRISLMWQSMRSSILQLAVPPQLDATRMEDVIANMEANYVRDSYHSLSIEGYKVTEGLIEKVRSGNWDPAHDQVDSERRNALAARGYYQAFQQVKESVKHILSGKNAGEVFAHEHDNWHFELFQPCITAGIIKPSDLVGYRTHQVYIRGSKHTPLNPDAVRDAMSTLCDLLRSEPNALVRAVLGHFFFVFIHPYMDGNGRTARFLMNVMLVTGGYQWTIIPVELRNEYMAALETASVGSDILPFARLLIRVMK